MTDFRDASVNGSPAHGNPMNALSWYDALARSKARGEAFVLATVLGCTGSTPRDPDAKMLVTAEDSFDTIGGGHLEFKVIQFAREMIARGESGHRLEHFPLGASLGQCCGGSVTVLLESFPATAFQVAVFGAGHVARALIPILGGLACQVRWIDSREGQFPTQVPVNVRCLQTELPVYEIDSLPAGADVLILTHNHQLDFELCEAALKRADLRHIGVIGSQTKADRFRQRLAHRGYDEQQIQRMCCPIGLADVKGKLPMEVAVSIAAQLIAVEQQTASEQQTATEQQTASELQSGTEHPRRPRPLRRGLAWKELRQAIGHEPPGATGQEVTEPHSPDTSKRPV